MTDRVPETWVLEASWRNECRYVEHGFSSDFCRKVGKKNEEKPYSTCLKNPFFGWFRVLENPMLGTRSVTNINKMGKVEQAKKLYCFMQCSSQLAEVKQTLNIKPWWFQIKTQISFYSRLPKNLKKWLKNLNQVKPILAIFRQRKLNQYNEIREEDISIIICDFLNNSYNQLFSLPPRDIFYKLCTLTADRRSCGIFFDGFQIRFWKNSIILASNIDNYETCWTIIWTSLDQFFVLAIDHDSLMQ